MTSAEFLDSVEQLYADMSEAPVSRPSTDLAAIWAAVDTSSVVHEDRLSSDEAKTIWEKIFRRAGVSGEGGQREVKSAVYAYFCVNGTSDDGDYNHLIKTGSGTIIPSSDVVHIIGARRYRKFVRANVDELYYSLKYNQALRSDEVLAQKCENKGIPASMFYLYSDALKGCRKMTSEENRYYEHAFSLNISKAAAARGGTIEDVRNGREQSRQRAQAAGALASHAVPSGDF